MNKSYLTTVTEVLADHMDIYAWFTVVFSSSKVEFEYILIDANTKEKSHKNLSSYGFWRRARDSNPRTGYSPLHDFQEDSGSPEFVDLHRVSHSHILVATARTDILIILVSGIYVTAVVVFPSSKVVNYSENIYPIKQSIHIQ